MLSRLSAALLVPMALTAAWAQTTVEGVVYDQAATGAPSASHASALEWNAGATNQHHEQGGIPLQHRRGGFVSNQCGSLLYPANYEFTLRARQPVSLTIELTAKSTVQGQVEVHAHYEPSTPTKLAAHKR